MDIREAWILLLPVLQMEIQFSRSANTVLWKTLGFGSPGTGPVSAFQLKSQLPEHQNFHSPHSISNHISYHCFSLLIAVDLLGWQLELTSQIAYGMRSGRWDHVLSDEFSTLLCSYLSPGCSYPVLPLEVDIFRGGRDGLRLVAFKGFSDPTGTEE